jgi:hypothetical protein
MWHTSIAKRKVLRCLGGLLVFMITSSQSGISLSVANDGTIERVSFTKSVYQAYGDV